MVLKKLSLVLLVMMACACQTTPGGIGASVITCCPAPGYRTFSSRTRDMPGFLVPLMKTNFDAAFGARGMVLNEEDPDLEVVLYYEQENLPGPEETDDFEGHLTPGGKVRYVAVVKIDMFNASSGELVWSGSIQRIHDVDPGEYMHTGKASLAIFQAFNRVLEDFSVPPDPY